MKYVDIMDLGLYDSKQDNKPLEGSINFSEEQTMSNHCPSLKMPPARQEGSSLLTYDSKNRKNREEDFIKLDYKLNFYKRVQAFVAIGRSLNILGHTFKLKEQYMTAAWILEKEKIRFEIVSDETSVSQLVTH